MKVTTLFAAALILVAGSALRANDPIKREGSGAHRAKLDAMELKPFNASLFAGLNGWTNGEALTAENTKGKVVLVATWSSFYQTSQTALPMLQSLSAKYAKDGLVVLAVHHDHGWEKAADVAKAKGYSGLFAHDVGNAFRKGIVTDQDPVYYFVDRAGNLRFAGVMTSNVDQAAALLVAESAEDAAALPGKLATQYANAEKESGKTKTLSTDLKPGQVIDVPFTMPDASAFEAAQWPEKNTESLSATNVQGSPLPAALGNESYIGAAPKTAGRVVVIDFWATWCHWCHVAAPKIDDLQVANKRDLVVIGISDEDKTKVEQYLNANKRKYAQAVDTSKTVNKALAVQGIPHCVVISTDGTVRWQGNPNEPNFIKAVQKVIAADPGVKARQKAEADYLKAHGG